MKQLWFPGYFIYFTYGIRHSSEGALQEKENETKKSFQNINRISLMPNEKACKTSYTISTIMTP